MLPQTGSLRHWVRGCSVALVLPIVSATAATPPQPRTAAASDVVHRPVLVHIQPAAVTSSAVPARCVQSVPLEIVDWERGEIELTAGGSLVGMDIRRLDDRVGPASPMAQPLPDEARGWLQRWELASQHQPRLSERDRTWIERMNTNRVSPLARSIALMFLERVQVADLERRFSWSIAEVTSDACVLQAVPREETERLFLPALRVSLDLKACSVTQVEVSGRNQPWTSIALQDPPPARLPADQQTLADAIPPSPIARPTAAPLIRFAADTIEVEIR